MRRGGSRNLALPRNFAVPPGPVRELCGKPAALGAGVGNLAGANLLAVMGTEVGACLVHDGAKAAAAALVRVRELLPQRLGQGALVLFLRADGIRRLGDLGLDVSRKLLPERRS